MNRACLCSLICTGAVIILVLGIVCRSFADAANEECLACHGDKDLKSHKGKSRFIDPIRFALSAHGTQGVGCTSCHEGISPVKKRARIPHGTGVEPKCAECHERVNRQYSKSVHARVSKKICYSCHDPHYSVPFRQMSGSERQAICLKCHDAKASHHWLPQKLLHFDYLECTSCHALNAEIGLVFYLVDNSDRSSQDVLDYEQLKRTLASGATGIAEALDRDANNRVSDGELASLIEKLQRNGLPNVGLKANILVLKPTHNFTKRAEHTRDCTLCHSRDARFYAKVLLVIPEKDGGIRTFPLEKGILARRGQRPYMEDVYLLGESKVRKEDLQHVLAVLERVGFKWIDIVGLAMFGFSLMVAFIHATLMFLTRSYRKGPRYGEIVEPASVPLKVWHWVHGLNVFLLLVTGIQLRLPDIFPLFATFLNAVNLHNLCGTLVALDYLFWLSYNLWKRRLKSCFFVSPSVLFRDTLEVLHYYWYLIFTGGSYPKTYGDYRLFDPVERVFFLVMMLLLVPVQILTGALLYDVHTSRPLIRALGGLRLVDAAHLLSAYVLISLIVIHLYFHALKKYHRLKAEKDRERSTPPVTLFNSD